MSERETGMGVGRPGVARSAVERGAANPLELVDEGSFWARQELLWSHALCRPGADGDAERSRVDPRLTAGSWTAESGQELARAARGCVLACTVAAECVEQMVRIQQATGTRLCSVAVAGQTLSWRGRESDALRAGAGWTALPLRVVGEEVA